MSPESSGPHPPTTPSILVADDDRRVRELLEIALTAHGFNVFTASDGEEAVKRVLCEHPDLRELAFGVGRELHRSPDLDTLAQRLLMAVQSRLGVGAAALLALGRTGDDL